MKDVYINDVLKYKKVYKVMNTYSCEDFVSKASVSKEQHNPFYEKYALLYHSYTCFLDNPTPAPSYAFCQTPYQQKPNNYKSRNNNHVKSNKKGTLVRDNTRTLVGFLNVVNIDNYSRVYPKIRLIIDQTNIEKVIEEILEKSCIATIFVNVYIKLLQDISNVYNIKPIIEKHAKVAVGKFHFKRRGPTVDEYDIFCQKQKHKLYILGLNTTMIKLCKSALINWEILLNYFKYFENLVTFEKDEYCLDLAINIVIDLGKAYRALIEDPESLASHIDCKIPRIRYLVQGLAELNH